MNILLTTSAAPSHSPFSTSEKRFPIGIGFLISVLRDAGHKVFFIDNYLKPTKFLENKSLQKNKIDFIGIYANTICYRDALRMLRKIEEMRKKGTWEGKIIVGGPHASVALETIPEFVDFIVQGEGERAILNIVEGQIKDRVVKESRIEDLDSLPMPAYDYFANLPYDFTTKWTGEKPIFNMNTSRGCPFDCAFCSVGSIWGRKYSCFSAQRIIEEIKYLVEKYNVKGIYFREDNFTLNRNRVIEFCEGLLTQSVNIKWVCETRVDTLSYELLKLMCKSGCKGLYFGVESGSQRMLDFMKKGVTIEQVEKVFDWCNKLDIEAHASFVIGAPTETAEERKKTIEFSKKIKATTCGFNVFVGIPKSELYNYVLDKRLYEFIDDRGLLYLRGHDRLVDKFYFGNPAAKIPYKDLKRMTKAKIKLSNILKRCIKKVLGKGMVELIKKDFLWKQS